MKAVNTEVLERELYRAFEARQRLTFARPPTDGIRPAAGDGFGAYADAVRLTDTVGRLPPSLKTLVEAKYGRYPEALEALCRFISETGGVAEAVARNILLQWLHYPDRPDLKEALPHFPASYSTLKRKCRKICLELDVNNLESLEMLTAEFLIESL
nr:MAG TPA: hypothetical protein [Caudoviricetes sp.]